MTPHWHPVRPGSHDQLGATVTASGTTFAVWAPDATAMQVCLLDGTDETRYSLPEQTLGIWHGEVPGVGAGQRYGFRADGPYHPPAGRRFNPDRLLTDPYARALSGRFDSTGPVLDVTPGPSGQDSASCVPHSVVVQDDFDWGDDAPPGRRWSDSVVYEAHVRGLTMQHPDVPPHLRGTYAGLAHPAVVNELLRLGVTAVELLPVHHFVTEPVVSARGLVNYWGYNSLGFFAPHAAYSSAGDSGGQVTEFKTMVKDLHAAGLEVLLDVVYNHTAEGAPGGPTLSLRGLGDGAYYRQGPGGSYSDVTGCGNTVAADHPAALRLIMDSLRYWVSEMHVDGFRFDLASALLRTGHRLDLRAPLLTAINQDPVLREVKLVAEPWDASPEGYLVGRFPPPWCEWNDRFRDTLRDFWRQRSGGVRDLAYRLAGSSDLYADDGRSPFSSINFITAHDGFTLRDLVSYNDRHNEANAEQGRDGHGDNRSWNCGVEGDSDDPAVVALRQRQAANLLGSLLLATGVPMLTAGDERGRTQRGNNNAYCHDSPLTWVDWEPDATWAHLTELVTDCLSLRREHPVLRQRHFFAGQPVGDGRRKDLTWLHPRGDEMRQTDWFDERLHTLGMLLNGEPADDDSLLLWLHAGDRSTALVAPSGPWSLDWDVVVDTSQRVRGQRTGPGTRLTVPGRTLLLLRARR